MQHLEVSSAVRHTHTHTHTHIYDIRRQRVKEKFCNLRVWFMFIRAINPTPLFKKKGLSIKFKFNENLTRIVALCMTTNIHF
jgi:hypothetical protein